MSLLPSRLRTPYLLPVFITASVMITWATGYMVKNAAGNILLILTMLWLARKNTSTSLILLLFLVFCALYAPAGLTYGKINNGFIASFLQTNILEVKEFIRLIPLSHFLVSLAIILFAILFWRTRQHGNNRRVILLIFIALSVNSWPKRMVASTLNGTLDILREMKHYAALAQQQQDSWKILSAAPRYQTVVVVIGESVRRGYLSAYGYPLPTTPWLNQAPGLFINGYTSAAANTVPSLSRTLVPDYEPGGSSGNNVVSLANRAGYQTWWISNQGRYGVHDTLISVIAHNATHPVFLKNGSYASQNIDDDGLLPEIQQAITTPASPKVIFVHMMGSHPNTCDRLFSFPNHYQGRFNRKASCYLASINKLDHFLQRLHDMLRQQGPSFALMYFSDHGMSVDNSDSPVRHEPRLQAGYEVPLILLTSDMKTHVLTDITLSARHFTGVFEWLTDIRTRNIPPVNPGEIRGETPVMVFNGEKNIPLNTLPTQLLLTEKQ